jgi:hypothetical protein
VQLDFATARTFAIAGYQLHDFRFGVLDFSHVNEALVRGGAQAVDGVVGADLLLAKSGVIDYVGQALFLK